MPMSYPPLANGSYRVGDPPQRFPSAVPGPSASPNLAPGGVYGYAVAAPPAAPPTPTPTPTPTTRMPGGTAAGMPGAAPPVPVPVYPPAGFASAGAPQSNPAGNTVPAWGAPPAAIPPRPTGRRNLLIAFGGAAVVALIVAALLIIVPRETGGSGGISAQGILEIDSPVAVGGHDTCYVPPSLEPAVSGDIEILSGQSSDVVARVPLEYSDGSLGHCTFTFDYSGIPEGSAPYGARLGDYGVVELSEQEVRDGISIVLGN